MISVPPSITMLIICLLCWALGLIMAHEAHEVMLSDYLRMSREERFAMRQGCLMRLWHSLTGR
jgi:hypothetical protein